MKNLCYPNLVKYSCDGKLSFADMINKMFKMSPEEVAQRYAEISSKEWDKILLKKANKGDTEPSYQSFKQDSIGTTKKSTAKEAMERLRDDVATLKDYIEEFGYVRFTSQVWEGSTILYEGTFFEVLLTKRNFRQENFKYDIHEVKVLTVKPKKEKEWL